MKVPLGRFGSPVRLMLKSIKSVRLPDLLFPRIGVVDNRRPALAPPNGTVFTKGRNAPPLFEMEKAEDGILPPVPSVKADAAVLKNA